MVMDKVIGNGDVLYYARVNVGDDDNPRRRLTGFGNVAEDCLGR